MVSLDQDFLISLQDRLGDVAAIYRGPVSAQRLLADLKLLDASPTQQRDAAVPFPGRWDSKLTLSRPGPLVDVFARYDLAAKSIFNIIDPSQFRYRERSRPRAIFLHNRRLEKLYNVPCILRAFAIVQRRYPDAALTAPLQVFVTFGGVAFTISTG